MNLEEQKQKLITKLSDLEKQQAELSWSIKATKAQIRKLDTIIGKAQELLNEQGKG